MRGRASVRVLGVAGVLGTDLGIKAWAVHAWQEPVQVASWLYLTASANSQILLGAMEAAEVGMIHTAIVLAVLGWLGWRTATAGSDRIAVWYGLITAGFASNVLDRMDGDVIDYLAVGPLLDGKWVIFNLADILMFAGLVAIGIMVVRRTGRRGRDAMRGAVDESVVRTKVPLKAGWQWAKNGAKLSEMPRMAVAPSVDMVVLTAVPVIVTIAILLGIYFGVGQ